MTIFVKDIIVVSLRCRIEFIKLLKLNITGGFPHPNPLPEGEGVIWKYLFKLVLNWGGGCRGDWDCGGFYGIKII